MEISRFKILLFYFVYTDLPSLCFCCYFPSLLIHLKSRALIIEHVIEETRPCKLLCLDSRWIPNIYITSDGE